MWLDGWHLIVENRAAGWGISGHGDQPVCRQMPHAEGADNRMAIRVGSDCGRLVFPMPGIPVRRRCAIVGLDSEDAGIMPLDF